MAVKLRNTTNTGLLDVDYSKAGVIKDLLRNWSGLESMSRRGDRVATCVLVDLKRVTGIDLDTYDPKHRDRFNKRHKLGVLSHYQYMSIAYTLVLGYSQHEVAFVMGTDQSVVAKNIRRGVKRISRALEGASKNGNT